MTSFNRYNSSPNLNPSAPPLPPSSTTDQRPSYLSSYSFSSSSYNPTAAARPPYAYPYVPPPNPNQSYPYPSPSHGGVFGDGGAYFPPGTPPEIIRRFQDADWNRSGFLDEGGLLNVLSSSYPKFSIRTMRLILLLFKSPGNHPGIGPNEFVAVWDCLTKWQAIFERMDNDQDGRIDSGVLNNALHHLGYAVPSSVIKVLASKYDDGSGQRRSVLSFEDFVECGALVKGLTEKFKERDTQYSGSATFAYETFMSMIISFIV